MGNGKKCDCEGVASQDFRARTVQLAPTEYMMIFQSEESNTEIDGHRSTWTWDFKLSSIYVLLPKASESNFQMILITIIKHIKNTYAHMCICIWTHCFQFF